MVRSAAAGSGATAAIDPFAAVGTEFPREVTDASGGGPSHGPSTRASTPARRNAWPSPNTCPCTPPGNDRL